MWVRKEETDDFDKDKEWDTDEPLKEDSRFEFRFSEDNLLRLVFNDFLISWCQGVILKCLNNKCLYIFKGKKI